MEKHVGTSAGLLALLAFLIHTLMPPSSEQRSNGTGAKTAGETHTNTKGRAGGTLVPEEGPWLASRQYFHQELLTNFKSTCIDYLLPPLGEKQATCDAAAMDKLFGLGSTFDPKELTMLVATIPDPLHTRMSLATDRSLDAIQQGAFRMGWELATQWLPWTAKASQISEGPGSATAPHLDLEKMPGLIVFRRQFGDASVAKQLLFVFVAGETPTAGINGFQFEAARRCIEGLSGTRYISILGPTFSGSFLSLTKLIEGDGGKGDYNIRSGLVTNSRYAESMLKELTPLRNVEFHGSALPSVSFEAQFKKLAAQQRFTDREIAELVEDESGFSVGVANPFPGRYDVPGITTYRYPRDIAQLRDAYSDMAFSSSQGTGAAAPQALQFSLKDTQSGESDFPIFSTSHTPVSQNAILEQIVSDLRRERVRLISLSATNVFDTLFIANVLAKEYPDLRVVVRGADLLFVQEAAQSSLSGILAISPFPMFPKGFEWANGGKHEATTFADADSVGEYNAALALLGGDVKDSLAFAPSLQNNERSFSSAWLLVLGRYGWAPVDLLDQYDRTLLPGKPGQERTWFDRKTKPDSKAKEGAIPLPLPAASKGWSLLCLLMACLSLGFCGRWAYLRWRPKVRTWSVLCSIDLQPGIGISRLTHARYICLFGCLSSLVFLNGILLTPMTNSGAASSPLYWLVMGACACPFLVESFLLYQTLMCQKNAPKDPADDVTARYLWGVTGLRILLLLLPLAGLFFWRQLCFERGARGPFFTFRVLSLAFPVSPIWPLLLGTMALFIAAVFHLRRLTWADRQRPLLETSTLDKAVWGQLGEANEALDCAFSGPARTKPKVRLVGIGAMAGVVFLLALLFPEQSLRSFESRSYEWMLVALFLPLSLVVTSSFVRFAFSWRILRGLLTTLNSLAIGRFFGRLPDFDGSGPVWIRDLKLMSLATSVNSAIALHNLKLAKPQKELDPLVYWNALKTFLSREPERDRGQILKEYREFVQEGADITKILSEGVLLPFWQTHRIPFVQAGNRKEAEAEAPLVRAATVGGSSQLASLETPAAQVNREGYEMASEYVALQYAVFIGYALRHIQNLLLCSVLSFVFLVLALNSFSFQAPQAISRLTLMALAAGGIVVVRALAQIERNPIVSRISGNEEGALGKDFYLRVLTYGALPVFTVLGTQFPSIARFLTSWAEPTLEALK